MTKRRGVLEKLRVRLRFTIDEVATQTGWPKNKLRVLERSDDPDGEEAEILGDLYGADIGALLGQRSLPKSLVATLLRAQAEITSASTRFRIAEAVTVGREARELEKMLGLGDHWAEVSSFRSNPDLRHPDQHGQELLTATVRKRLSLGNTPILSMTDEVLGRLRVLALAAPLDPHIDAFAIASPATGGVIVLNEVGYQAAGAFRRRVTLAHELCHVLFDRDKLRTADWFCDVRQPDDDAPDKKTEPYKIERRARAFAPSLLLPLEAAREHWEKLSRYPIDRRIRILMEMFGIGFRACRAQLHNAALLPLETPISNVMTPPPPVWDERDPIPLARAPAFSEIRSLRRGQFLALVVEALSRGALSEAAARDYLRVPRSRWTAVSLALFETSPAKTPRTFSSSSSTHPAQD